MSYLVDTDLVAELSRRTPNPHVVAWFREVPDTALHLSVLTLGELRKGVESLAHVRRKERLRVWSENDLADWFGERLLPVTAAVAERWGRLLAEAGRPVPAVDSLLAATALQHGLRMVTRNTQDFGFPGLDVVNPWEHGKLDAPNSHRLEKHVAAPSTGLAGKIKADERAELAFLRSELARLRAENRDLRSRLGQQDLAEAPDTPIRLPSPAQPPESNGAPSVHAGSSPEEKVRLFRQFFRGREDVYAVR